MSIIKRIINKVTGVTHLEIGLEPLIPDDEWWDHEWEEAMEPFHYEWRVVTMCDQRILKSYRTQSEADNYANFAGRFVTVYVDGPS